MAVCHQGGRADGRPEVPWAFASQRAPWECGGRTSLARCAVSFRPGYAETDGRAMCSCFGQMQPQGAVESGPAARGATPLPGGNCWR